MSNNETIWELLKQYTPNGTQTLSKMPNRFIEGIYPKVLANGKDGRVWDEDGNVYVDLISGLGAISVGYCNDTINKAVIEQMGKGISFSLPTRLEYELAKKLTELVPFTEQWKFLKTGSEATAAAVKAARAYTKREKVMVCGYHGWMDWYSIVNDRKAGIPAFNEALVTKAVYNKFESFTPIQTKEYAAVILEPYVFEMPDIGFLNDLALMCRTTGTILIYDEVVTGGRTKGFVAASMSQLKPDLIVLSKGVANGFPLAAVGGPQSLMSVFERNDFFVSGTFGGECLSITACLETIEIIEKNIDQMCEKGNEIKECFNTLFQGKEKTICKGYPTRLTFDFPTTQHKALFMQEMCINRVLTGYSNFIMADHTADDMSVIFDALRNTKNVMFKHWDNPQEALKGKEPEAVLRLR